MIFLKLSKHKPGDKVTVTYLRDKKEQKATAELGRWKGYDVFSKQLLDLNDMGDMDFDKIMPRN